MANTRYFSSRIACALFALCLILTAGSCSTTTVENYITQTGSIIGTVSLSDADTQLTDLAGVRVTLEGTAFTAITDSLGRWQMDHVPARSYKLNLTRENFGEVDLTVLHYGIAPTIVPSQRLCKIPSCPPYLDSLMHNAETSYLMGHVPCVPENTATRVVYFFSNSPDVSKEEGMYQAQRLTSNAQLLYCPVSHYDFMPGGEWGSSGIDPTQRIYVVAYAVGCVNYWFKSDQLIGEPTYSSISNEPSNVFSFILP